MSKPNVEKEVISWLEIMLGDSWPVFGDQPKERPQGYILVDRTGGPRESIVLDRAEILIEVYHKNSRVQASDKANEIADNIVSLLDREHITRAVVNSVVNLDDLTNQYSRYQIYCDVYCRR